MENKREIYEAAELEIVCFEAEDVIATSGDDGGIDLPDLDL